MIWWCFVFEQIEWVSTIVLFRMFIYLNIIRAGDIQLYTLFVLETESHTENIAAMMDKHSYQPAWDTFNEFGWLCPWADAPLRNFFTAARMSTEAYTGYRIGGNSWPRPKFLTRAEQKMNEQGGPLIEAHS